MSREDHLTPERIAFEAQASDPSYKFKISRKGHYINPALARDWKWFQAGARYAAGPQTHAGGVDLQPGSDKSDPGAADQHDTNRSRTQCDHGHEYQPSRDN